MGKNTKLALTLNIVFFVLVLLVHLYRILTGFYVQIGGWIVPIWLNVVGVVIIMLLLYLNYKAL